LNHFDISTPKISFHEHNKASRIPELLTQLRQGACIAQVSDAGTPSISDPGYELVTATIAENMKVIPLPGANAALTALIGSGLPTDTFFFKGFLSHKKNDKKQELEVLRTKEETLIFYESPHELKKTIKEMAAVLGAERRVVLARELTKQYEEWLRGTLEETVVWTEKNKIRGEFCIIVEGNRAQSEAESFLDTISLSNYVKLLMAEEGLSSKEAIKRVSELREIPKREVYAAYHELSN
jgi:16S rRNA (cytidine1402-2'-O)-methyltransferase